jgi:predicted thioredoxin/glutaredoxin
MLQNLRIDVYLSEGCGSYYELREILDRSVAMAGIQAKIVYHTIYYDDAVSLSIKGSPTIWINGKDAFAGGRSPGIS